MLTSKGNNIDSQNIRKEVTNIVERDHLNTIDTKVVKRFLQTHMQNDISRPIETRSSKRLPWERPRIASPAGRPRTASRIADRERQPYKHVQNTHWIIVMAF